MAWCAQGPRVILRWQTEALEPVHQVVGERQRVEVCLIGRNL
jgi:hypothetical protein